MQENLAQKTLVKATPHLISGDRFQKVNTQNLKIPVYNSFLCNAQHFAVIFFSVMKFVKSSHRATLKNQHLGKLIGTASTTYCPEFRGL